MLLNAEDWSYLLQESLLVRSCRDVDRLSAFVYHPHQPNLIWIELKFLYRRIRLRVGASRASDRHIKLDSRGHLLHTSEYRDLSIGPVVSGCWVLPGIHIRAIYLRIGRIMRYFFFLHLDVVLKCIYFKFDPAFVRSYLGLAFDALLDLRLKLLKVQLLKRWWVQVWC